MKMDSKLAQEILLDYLDGNEEKLNYYLQLLSHCRKAADVADRVIRRMFLTEELDSKLLSRVAFYGPIACLATELTGHKLEEKTLYYHINTNLSHWLKERREQTDAQQQAEKCYVDTQISWSLTGVMNTHIHIHSLTLPEEFQKLLQPYLELGYAQLKEKMQKLMNAQEAK